MTRRRGYTLIEVVIVLALFALAIGVAYPGARAAADGWAVRSARDAVGAVLAGARTTAMVRHGAEVLLVPERGAVLLRAAGDPPMPRLDVGRDWGVVFSSPGFTGDTIVIRYDAIGIGRIANRTLRFERGSAHAGLTVSAYGRVRAW